MADASPRRPCEPPRLYSWTVVAPGEDSPSLGAVGVSDDYGRAITSLGEALRDFPAGSRGLVHKVMLSFTRPGYLYESLMARGRYDSRSRTVVWETIPAPAIWGGKLYPRVTDLPADIGDAYPPEAIAAGLADYEAEQGRQQWA